MAFSRNEVKMRNSSAQVSGTETGPSMTDFTRSVAAAFYLDVTAESGTETLDVRIEEEDAHGIWHTAVSFTQATGVTKERKVIDKLYGKRIRYVGVEAGGGTMTWKLSAVAHEG